MNSHTLSVRYLTGMQVIAFWEEFVITVGCHAQYTNLNYRYLQREYLAGYQNSKIVLLQPPMVMILKESKEPRLDEVRRS